MAEEEKDEDLDSKTEDDDTSIDDDIEDVNALKEKLSTLSGKNRQLFARAKKAEGFVFTDGKWVKPELKSDAGPDIKNKKGELDYGQKAYLLAKGLNGTDEMDLFLKEKEKYRDDIPLEDVFEGANFQVQLKDLRTLQEAKDALPQTGPRSTSSPRDLVAYHLAKKTPLFEIQDQDVRRQVRAAKEKQVTDSNKFTDVPVIQ